jgi:GxxExxY protein
MLHSDVSPALNEITGRIVDSAMQVHKELGAGFSEKIYREAFEREAVSSGLNVIFEKQIPIIYKRQALDSHYRLDCLVNDKIIVEFKTVEKILPIHKSQIQSYLKATNLDVGFLINFNEVYLKDGLHRIIRNNKQLRFSETPRLNNSEVTEC